MPGGCARSSTAGDNARAVVEMRAGEGDRGPSALMQDVTDRAANAPPPPVAPVPPLAVPPAGVAQMERPVEMPPPAMLATSLGPHEPDEMRDRGRFRLRAK